MISNRQPASRKSGVATRCLCAMVLAAPWVEAGVAAGQTAAQARPASEPRSANISTVDTRDPGTELNLARQLRSIKPKVNGYLAAPLWSKLSFAYRVARERVRTMPSCSTLFARRGADGLGLLASATFAEAAPGGDQTACTRSAALTEVGGRQIRLCPRFETLAPSAAALVLIHETLHNAGMSEKPADPSGLTSGEINRLVELSCGR